MTLEHGDLPQELLDDPQKAYEIAEERVVRLKAAAYDGRHNMAGPSDLQIQAAEGIRDALGEAVVQAANIQRES